jgi:chromosomal replication initiation ATPase DnaA
MSRCAGPRQLALPLPHKERFAREDFLEGAANASALALIDRWPDWPARTVGLVGPEGSGKSHLAAIWGEAAGARLLSARALAEIDPPAALATGALAVEDLSADDLDERALFHLLNLAHQEQSHLLITTRTALTAWRVQTADLASRLRAVPMVELQPPDDALLRAVLIKLFADRQLNVDQSLVSYLANRIERSFEQARSVVAEIDRRALRLGRPLSRTLAAEILYERGLELEE